MGGAGGQCKVQLAELNAKAPAGNLADQLLVAASVYDPGTHRRAWRTAPWPARGHHRRLRLRWAEPDAVEVGPIAAPANVKRRRRTRIAAFAIS